MFVTSKRIGANISNNWNLLTIIVSTPAQVKTRFLVSYLQHPNTKDDALLRAPPDRKDPPAVQEFLKAIGRACTLSREAIRK
jgi:hypothetical protein